MNPPPIDVHAVMALREQDMRFDDIAKRVGASPGAVRKLVSRHVTESRLAMRRAEGRFGEPTHLALDAKARKRIQAEIAEGKRCHCSLLMPCYSHEQERIARKTTCPGT